MGRRCVFGRCLDTVLELATEMTGGVQGIVLGVWWGEDIPFA